MATRPACPDLAGPRLSESDGGQVAGGLNIADCLSNIKEKTKQNIY